MGYYTYVCPLCQHLTSGHRLVAGGDLRGGPYRCQECGCERPQDAGDIGMSQRQVEEHLAKLAGTEQIQEDS